MQKNAEQKIGEGPCLDLPITLGTELIIELVNLKHRIKSSLVGMEQGKYIIVKLSENDLIGNFRSEHVKESPMIIRYLHRGAVYGFKSSIVNIVSIPAKLFFVTYPTKLEEFTVINNARHECILPAVTMIGNDFVDMVIIDISKQGCLCMIKTKAQNNEALFAGVQVNKTIDIKAQFPGTDGKFGLKGKIRNVSKDVDKILLGVQFDEMPPDVKDRLDNFLSLIAKVRDRQ
ncbi:MAG: flagellar brake protein [Deltaproteobacteria bacterium]|nr:flagellar brake protein [Deltaproteobacteria bacterium]